MEEGVDLIALLKELEKSKNEAFVIEKFKEFIFKFEALKEKNDSLEFLLGKKQDAENSNLTKKQEEEISNLTHAQCNGHCLIEESEFNGNIPEEPVDNCNIKTIQNLRKQIKESELLKAKQTEEQNLKCLRLENKIQELNAYAQKHKDQLENQIELSSTLQNELQASYKENESLAREMETLNLMFAELEQNIFSQEKEASTHNEPHQNESIASQKKSAKKNPEDFDEIFSEQGNRKVISVSKTFLKLKSLILEKKSLEEQLSKMKHVYKHFCSQVNLHEEKLCNITDELNSTWFYVSKIKEQHRKLHSSEQILRAELAEKRVLLTKLRTELEESKQSWNIVKQKTADSEKQWIALKADFAEQKRILFSKDDESTETEKDQSITTEKPAEDLTDEDLENMEIPDPFGEDDQAVDPLLESPTILTIPQTAVEFPVFVPPASYVANVPSDFHPPLFFPDNQEPDPSKCDKTEDDVDENITNLISRLMSSTARGAFLANRLSDIHKRIAAGTALAGVEDQEEEEDTTTEVEDTATEVDSEEPEEVMESDISLAHTENQEDSSNPQDSDSDEIEEIDVTPGFSRPSYQTQMSAVSVLSDTTELNSESLNEIPPPPPPPSFSLAPPAPRITVRPMFDQVEEDDSENERTRNSQSPESSTAVTRFLIKHLPKQLSKLRNEKAELEERIRELEHVGNDQRNTMLELERRIVVDRTQREAIEENMVKMYSTFAFVVKEENRKLRWFVTNQSEIPPALWITYHPMGEEEKYQEVLPSNVKAVHTLLPSSLMTVLETVCAYSGVYTLHTEGRNTGKVSVKLEEEEYVEVEFEA